MGKVWIEAALNGAWGRALQPNIPIAVKDIVADGVAVANAGASIIHLHAYDETTSRQKDDWQIYARIIEGIRDGALITATVCSALITALAFLSRWSMRHGKTGEGSDRRTGSRQSAVCRNSAGRERQHQQASQPQWPR